MDSYNFENGKTGVSLVDYLGLEEDEQIEDTSGITQVCMDRDIGDDTNDDDHGNEDDSNDAEQIKGYILIQSLPPKYILWHSCSY